MSISHDSVSTIICKEVFDENSQPSEKEILDYAKRLGIDPDNEPYLLELAREGLMAALPKGWKPVYDDSTRSFYYYKRSTNVSTWEHPLDAVYKELVAQARASNRHRASVDENMKIKVESTCFTDVEQDATDPDLFSCLPPLEPTLLTSQTTRIPLNADLKHYLSENSSVFSRRFEYSFDSLTRNWESGDAEFENDPNHRHSSLSSNKTLRNYKNLHFQDPEFYQSPKVIEIDKKKLDLRDVFKRSESLSPRYEKDWKQLSDRLNTTEENIIDIDNLSATSLSGKQRISESQIETAISKIISPLLQKQKQNQHPKELTLSGGGSIFLKGNKSRDLTPCTEEMKLNNFQTGDNDSNNWDCRIDEMTTSDGERLKSILREKNAEDDDKPLDEERKSVRFDLQKISISTKFNENDSCEEVVDSEIDEQTSESLSIAVARRDAAVLSLQQVLNRQEGIDFGESSSFVKKIDMEKKKSKIVGKRFIVENVSEKEHKQQQDDKYNDKNDELIFNRFENVKNIELILKSDSEKTTPRSSADSKSSFVDNLRRNKEVMLDNMRKAELRANKNEDYENKCTRTRSFWSTKILSSLELFKEGNNKSPSYESPRFRLEIIKNAMINEQKEDLKAFKQDLENKLQERKKYLEEEFNEQKLVLESNIQHRLVELKKNMADKEEEEIEKFMSNMNVTRDENLKKVKNELEVCYEKERQDILTNLKTELDRRKHELLEFREQEISKLEKEHDKELKNEKQIKKYELQIIKQHNEKTENLKHELEKKYDFLRMELRVQQRDKITKITQDHEKCLADILRDFRKDEGVARKVYKQKLDEIRADYSKDIENEVKKHNEFAVQQESVDFEKIRCQKRLLEDKYNTLKEKYLKLKNDMRAANEKRLRHKEQLNSTMLDIEMFSKTKSDGTESSDQKLPLSKINSVPNSKAKDIPNQNLNTLNEQQSELQQQHQQYASATAANQILAMATSEKSHKFESDDTTTCSETTSNVLTTSKRKKSLTRKSSNGFNKLNNNVMDNPVENIRKQLEKLEDLEDQLPSNDTAYILRYPFQDKSPSNVCSELEFFRHRIHVERDSVKRAREALRQQRSAFQSRQKASKQQSTWATLEQLVKEERDLSDMEVSLHRTRSLLGEKEIHLRYLEQSLERVANSKRIENEHIMPISGILSKNDEMTLSDISSSSSGFSSTDLAKDIFIDKYCHYQESTEIIASLENLNSEIREIWGVLNKRQDNNIQPPPTLMYSDLSWFPYQRLNSQSSPVSAFGKPNIQSNILSQVNVSHPSSATHNIIAQYGPTSGYTSSVGDIDSAAASNLTEKTRNLKDWLRQARVESFDLVSPGKVTL